jgi:hypothetical protein
MGRKSAWAAARAEVMASGVMVAGWEIWRQFDWRETHVVKDMFLSYWLCMN